MAFNGTGDKTVAAKKLSDLVTQADKAETRALAEAERIAADAERVLADEANANTQSNGG